MVDAIIYDFIGLENIKELCMNRNTEERWFFNDRLSIFCHPFFSSLDCHLSAGFMNHLQRRDPIGLDMYQGIMIKIDSDLPFGIIDFIINTKSDA